MRRLILLCATICRVSDNGACANWFCVPQSVVFLTMEQAQTDSAMCHSLSCFWTFFHASNIQLYIIPHRIFSPKWNLIPHETRTVCLLDSKDVRIVESQFRRRIYQGISAWSGT
jgi:hypothetical protein